ncbi:MAG: ABC transporter permease, partial [Bacillota bacterium]|nr:ABC transporter permease [Bacillota bacterium]
MVGRGRASGVASSWRIYESMKMQCAYSFLHGNTIFITLIQPVMFTISIYMMFRAGGDKGRFALATLGGGLMSAWNSIVVSSGRVLEVERSQGTLDGLLISPTPAFVVIGSKVLFNVLLSFASIILSYVSCRIIFGISLSVVIPVGLVLAFLGLGAAIWAMGLVMASGFLLSPNNRRMIELLNFPIYLLAGFVVPLSRFPLPVQIAGRLIPLSWATD